MEFANRWDPHLWHVDEEAAEASFFGGLVASGVHTFAAFTNLLTTNFLLDVAVTAGKDINLQMRAPVRPDEEIHARVTVAALEDVPRRDGQGLVQSWPASATATTARSCSRCASRCSSHGDRSSRRPDGRRDGPDPVGRRCPRARAAPAAEGHLPVLRRRQRLGRDDAGEPRRVRAGAVPAARCRWYPERDLRTTICGHEISMPVGLSSCGQLAIGHRDGECGVARAAGAANDADVRERRHRRRRSRRSWPRRPARSSTSSTTSAAARRPRRSSSGSSAPASTGSSSPSTRRRLRAAPGSGRSASARACRRGWGPARGDPLRAAGARAAALARRLPARRQAGAVGRDGAERRRASRCTASTAASRRCTRRRRGGRTSRGCGSSGRGRSS